MTVSLGPSQRLWIYQMGSSGTKRVTILRDENNESRLLFTNSIQIIQLN